MEQRAPRPDVHKCNKGQCMNVGMEPSACHAPAWTQLTLTDGALDVAHDQAVLVVQELHAHLRDLYNSKAAAGMVAVSVGSAKDLHGRRGGCACSPGHESRCGQ